LYDEIGIDANGIGGILRAMLEVQIVSVR